MDLQDLQEEKSHEEKVKETEVIYQKMLTNTSQNDINKADITITDQAPKVDSKNSVKEVIEEQKMESMGKNTA